MLDKKKVINDLKFLIKYSKETMENQHKSETEKGLVILTSYVAANSLYEKFSLLILDDILKNYNQDLRKLSKKIFLLKYRNGKKLNNLSIKDIDVFINGIKTERMSSDFKNDHKSLKDISNLFEFLKQSEETKKVIDKILLKRRLTFLGLQEQLQDDYKDTRTRVVHGDYKDIKTLYYLYRGKYLDFLINIYIAMKIMMYSEHL
ncbi:MAG: hypothetical protein ACRC4T_13195 [Cetobacterium sp.]